MKIYSNNACEVYATDSYERVQVGMHDKEIPDTRARYAMELVKYLAVPMTFDSHPNAKRATPAEVAAMACDLSAAVFDDIRRRGWIVEVPGIEEIAEQARESRGRN